jgi:hypothetical protein
VAAFVARLGPPIRQELAQRVAPDRIPRAVEVFRECFLEEGIEYLRPLPGALDLAHALTAYLPAMANSTSDGTELLHDAASISEARLEELMRTARRSLRQVAWGSPEEWTPRMKFRYATEQPLDILASDLRRLAVTGRDLYLGLFREIGRRRNLNLRESVDRIGSALRAPGHIQVALPDDARHVIPAALLYVMEDSGSLVIKDGERSVWSRSSGRGLS